MYCPGCGSEERQASQYCRACGTDLRVVRASLKRPDAITESAVTAREEIGRAMAEKIREVDDTRDLKRVAEDVLPQIRKFLESPEERRLRTMRAGVIAAAVGLGVGVPALLLAANVHDDQLMTFLTILFIVSLVTFLVGLGLVINGRLLTLLTQPRKKLEDSSAEAGRQSQLDAGYAPPKLQSRIDEEQLLRSPTTNELAQVRLRPGSSAPASITEHTTNLLKTER
jgi:hypothetical protein